MVYFTNIIQIKLQLHVHWYFRIFRNGKKINDTNLTTPAYEELYKYGYYPKERKHIYIFELSSHALDQNRIGNYPIDIAAITNISHDHLIIIKIILI